MTGNKSYSISSPNFFKFVTVLSNGAVQNLMIRQHLNNQTLAYNSTSFIKVYTHELCHTINYFMPPMIGEDLLITQEIKNETHREDAKMQLVDVSTGKYVVESHHLLLNFNDSKEVMVISTSTFSDPVQPYDYESIDYMNLWVVIAPQMRSLGLNELGQTDSNFVLDNAKISAPATSSSEISYNLAFVSSDNSQKFYVASQYGLSGDTCRLQSGRCQLVLNNETTQITVGDDQLYYVVND